MFQDTLRAPPSFRSGSRKKIFFLSVLWDSTSPSGICVAVWWGLLKHGRALVIGPALVCSGPEPGASQGTPGLMAPPCARWGGAQCQGSPHAGPQSSNIACYTASALAVDVPPGGWLQPGSRGDSLRGLVHTSPLRQPPRRFGTR